MFERVPAEYKDRIPKMMRGDDGGDGWSFDGRPPKRTFGVEAMAGRAKEDYQVSGLRFDQILPGNYDGVRTSLTWRSTGSMPASCTRRTLSSPILNGSAVWRWRACGRYNDWLLDDFQAASPEHLVGLPMSPVDDGMETCIAEYDRVLAKGARAAFIPGMPKRP